MPDFASFRTALPSRVAAWPDVTGLVWAGSSAEPERADAWSDHDFFLIVRTGTQERFRRSFTWLPDAERIAFAARETAHGCKVVYEDGFILEFAVFDASELAGATLNHHALAFGNDALREITASIVRNQEPYDHLSLDDHLGLFFALLLIGAGRHTRGERLVGGTFVRTYAVERLLRAARAHLPSADPAARDVLDAWRRAEREFPELAAVIDAALVLPVPEAAQALAALALEVFGQRSPVPARAHAVLSRRLHWPVS